MRGAVYDTQITTRIQGNRNFLTPGVVFSGKVLRLSARLTSLKPLYVQQLRNGWFFKIELWQPTSMRVVLLCY